MAPRKWHFYSFCYISTSRWNFDEILNYNYVFILRGTCLPYSSSFGMEITLKFSKMAAILEKKLDVLDIPTPTVYVVGRNVVYATSCCRYMPLMVSSFKISILPFPNWCNMCGIYTKQNGHPENDILQFLLYLQF